MNSFLIHYKEGVDLLNIDVISTLEGLLLVQVSEQKQIDKYKAVHLVNTILRQLDQADFTSLTFMIEIIINSMGRFITGC